MTIELKELTEAFKTNATEIKNNQVKMADEIKQNGEATAETKSALDVAVAVQNELKDQFEKMDEKLIELEKESKRVLEGKSSFNSTAGSLFVKLGYD